MCWEAGVLGAHFCRSIQLVNCASSTRKPVETKRKMVARGEPVLGARFTEIRHLGPGLYTLASAGGRAFSDHCSALGAHRQGTRAENCAGGLGP